MSHQDNNDYQNNNNLTSSTQQKDSQQQNNISSTSVLDISDPYISDKKVVAASLVDNSFGSNYNVLKKTHSGARVHSVNVVSAQDPRALWLDSSHRSERRNDHSIAKAAPATKNDIKYVREQDTYVVSDDYSKSAARNHYTDAERLAFSNLQKSKDLIMGTGNNNSLSVSRQRTSPQRNTSKKINHLLKFIMTD